MTKVSLIFILFSSFGINAQSHYGGLKIGPTIASTDRDHYDYYNSMVGLCADGLYQFNMKSITLQTALGYQHKGFSQKLTYVDSNNVVLGKGAIERVRHAYLGLSQSVGVKVGDRVYGFFNVGLRLSYYLNTVVSSNEFLLSDGNTVENYSWKFNYLKPIDLSAQIELGIGYKNVLDSKVFLSVSYDHGLREIEYTDEFKTDNRWKYQNINVQIGFSRQIFLKKAGKRRDKR